MRIEGEVVDRARDLLGRRLTVGEVSVVITEVEAYGGVLDPASHAFVRTPRSEIMYGPAGRLYVYRIHGHHCANIVTGPTDEAAAVLLRAGRVVDGHDVARERRPGVPDTALARGPGNLTRALAITMEHKGLEVIDPASPVRLGDRDDVPAGDVTAGPRVGVRLAADVPWRFWLSDPGSLPTVSAYRRHPKA